MRKSRKENKDCINLVNDLLVKYGRMTLRQIYYQLVPLGFNYRQVANIVQTGRERGSIDVDMIVDRSRESYGLNKWNTLEDALDTLESVFRLDYWNDQPYHVEIWTEKDAISQILFEESDKYRVPVRVTRGFLSTSLRHEWSNSELIILYFGDFDPSGLCMGNELANSKFLNYHEIKRVALTEDHIAMIKDLPSVPVKARDPCAKAYIQKYGTQCYEIDALPPDYLRKLVRESINQYVNFVLEQKIDEENEIREQIKCLKEKSKS